MNDNEENVTDMLKQACQAETEIRRPDEMITAVKALSENRKYFSTVSGIAMEYFVQQS